jgi:carbamoyl-phosphate synthase small subunit
LSLKVLLKPEGGQVFEGVCGFGQSGTYEIVFNTSMSGTTEVITDPASAGQALLLSYPLIGSSGVCYEDYQSAKPQVAALIVSQLSEMESNFRSETSLKAVLEREGIPLIAGVDTRSMVRLLRGKGPQTISITIGGKEPGPIDSSPIRYQGERRSVKADTPVATVAVPDTGLRRDLERALVSLGVSLEIFPQGDALSGEYDGYLIPGGPGDPAGYDLTGVKDILKTGKPIFAVGLGHQLLALAQGAKTRRLSPGHRGQNVPVRDEKTGKAFITTQNHGYAVDSIPNGVPASHVNVNDGTVEGIRWSENIISVQFSPDLELVCEFVNMLKKR